MHIFSVGCQIAKVVFGPSFIQACKGTECLIMHRKEFLT